MREIQLYVKISTNAPNWKKTIQINSDQEKASEGEILFQGNEGQIKEV
jgi:hypothetical protein